MKVSHDPTCPVNALGHERCNCDFGKRLAVALDVPYVELYAMLDATGRVIGLCEWDRKDEFDRSFRLVLADGAQIGWTYGAGLFSAPPDS